MIFCAPENILSSMRKKPTSVSAYRRRGEDRTGDLEMSVLYDISRAMVNRGRVSDMIGRTLEILREKLGLLRGTITLREADLLFIEASNGMSDSAVRRGVYRVGEGVTGRVAQEGKSIVIPDISKSSEFLDRTKSRGKSLKGIAFICVPIIYLEQAIGTLSIDVEGKNCAGADLERYRELLETIANILADAISTIYLRHAETKRLLDENRRLRLKFGGSLIRPKNMVGNCGAMQKVYEGMARASAGTDSVLIFGAPGTGKELCAREICSASPDFRKSFHVVNCAALSSEELLCEVFGCEEKYLGSNSPAKHGLLERFRNCTIFFDELAELSFEAVSLLSKAARSGTFRRMGGVCELKNRARFVFASCADMEELSALPTFSLEYFKRLAEDAIYIPALKDRKSDILLLAEHFLEKFNAAFNRKIKRISTPAINMLTVYSWPGNVRELENCIEHAVDSSHDSAISGYDLTAQVRANYSSKETRGEDLDFLSLVQSFERELITEALKSSGGKAAAAARKLGLSARMINYKIKKYSIVPGWYKSR